MKKRLVLLLACLAAVFVMSLPAYAAEMKLNKAKVNIGQGMSYTLKVQNAPEDAELYWYSKDKTIVKVNQKGKITGVMDGTAEVRCRVTDAAGKKTYLICEVAVKTPVAVNPKATVEVGEKIKLQRKYSYSKATYTWTSDNKDVCKVTKNGYAYGYKMGIANVTCTVDIPKVGTRTAVTYELKYVVTVTKDGIGLTKEDQDAIVDAKKYLEEKPYSNEELFQQLRRRYSYESTNVAMENCGADWKEQAVRQAELLAKDANNAYSQTALKAALEGHMYTVDEVDYALENAKVDYQQQAVKAVQALLGTTGYCEKEIVNKLTGKIGFTEEDVQAAIEQLNINWANEAKLRVEHDDYTGGKESMITVLTFWGFSKEDAEAGIELADIDWDKQAIKTAETQAQRFPDTRKGLIRSLQSGGYSAEQAEKAVNEANIDWNDMVVRHGKSYLNAFPDWTRSKLIEQLVYEGWTYQEAQYSADQNGL